MLLEMETHLISRAESQFFVEGATEIAGMQRETTQALFATPGDHRQHQLPGDPLPPEFRLRIDVQYQRALARRVVRRSRPIGDRHPGARYDASFRGFCEPPDIPARADLPATH